MPGYERVYFLGTPAGGEDDGIKNIQFIILSGYSDRQWLECVYFQSGIEPIGKIKYVMPESEGHPAALLDATIAFYPRFYKDCPSLPKVKSRLTDVTRLDFKKGKDNIPAEWTTLRKEAYPFFKKLHIFRADLEYMNLINYRIPGLDEPPVVKNTPRD